MVSRLFSGHLLRGGGRGRVSPMKTPRQADHQLQGFSSGRIDITISEKWFVEGWIIICWLTVNTISMCSVHYKLWSIVTISVPKLDEHDRGQMVLEKNEIDLHILMYIYHKRMVESGLVWSSWEHDIYWHKCSKSIYTEDSARILKTELAINWNMVMSDGECGTSSWVPIVYLSYPIV